MSVQQQIRLLPDHVANKIAAGEVVERPASIVKELMENSIDAGANSIEVRVVGGGRKLIEVADNGKGMSHDNAMLSIERHATSKIAAADDIERIATMGFRGEALAAISSVSRFTLRTCEQEADGGTELSMSGGKLTDVKDVARPAGTTISVRNLFFNTPARKKFLRSDQTELSHIRQTVLTYALAFPDVAFQLVIDGRDVFRLVGGLTCTERLRELFEERIMESLRPVELDVPWGTIRGFAGLPGISRNDRSGQYLFINRRPAMVPMLSYAIREGYAEVLPKDRHPMLFLFLEIDPRQVDVNVHPAKREVRFRRPQEVRDGVIYALKSALGMGVETRIRRVEQESMQKTGKECENVFNLMPPGEQREFSYPRTEQKTDHLEPRRGEDREPSFSPSPSGPWMSFRILGSIGNDTYILLETPDGLVIMDVHAAHERVLFESMLKSAKSKHADSQGLLAPETVEFPPKDAAAVRDNLSHLQEMGFGISEFGEDAFIIDALPACIEIASGIDLLLDIAHELERRGARGKSRLDVAQVAECASRSAVRSCDHPGPDEMKRLAGELASAEMPYTSPSGRPTVILMSYRELSRKFGR